MSDTYNKAQARLGKMVGYTVKVVMHDGSEVEGILDSFYCENNFFFIVLDVFYKQNIINFSYVSSIFPYNESEQK